MYGSHKAFKQGIIMKDNNNKGFSNNLDIKNIIISFIEWLNECGLKFELSVFESSKYYKNYEIVNTYYSKVTVEDFIEYTSEEDDNDDILQSCEIYLECNDKIIGLTKRIIIIDWNEMDYEFNFDVIKDGTCIATLNLKDKDTNRSFVFKRINE